MRWRVATAPTSCLGLLASQERLDGLAHFAKGLGAALIDGVGEGVPMRVIEVDQVHCRYSGIDEGQVVIVDGTLLRIGERASKADRCRVRIEALDKIGRGLEAV